METLTFDMIKNFALVLMALWGFYKVVEQIVDRLKTKFKKEQDIETLETMLDEYLVRRAHD